MPLGLEPEKEKKQGTVSRVRSSVLQTGVGERGAWPPLVRLQSKGRISICGLVQGLEWVLERAE